MGHELFCHALLLLRLLCLGMLLYWLWPRIPAPDARRRRGSAWRCPSSRRFPSRSVASPDRVARLVAVCSSLTPWADRPRVLGLSRRAVPPGSTPDGLSQVTRKVVEAARESLVIGAI
jgi:hypothetical protein